ncbi:MAG: efflux RND transporter periplasmic adaptor subunit [Bacteroidia bacterium]
MALAAFLPSCASHEAEIEETVKYVATSPAVMDTSIIREYVCQIRAIRHIELRALEKGYIQDIFVDEGQYIHVGQKMFQIMPKFYEAEQQRAQAEADFAEIEYKNTKRLADSNVVAPNELALAKAKLDKAKAELSLAQVNLGFTQLSAPFDGIMDRLQVRQGSLVDEGDLLTTLSDNSKMWVYFNVPEKEYLEYKMNSKQDSLTKVELKMANQQIFEFPGVVSTIESDFNNETGTIAFRATFPNPKGLLRHGETGNILMEVPMKGALLVPQKATFEVLEKKYVFVVDKDNVVHQQEVEVQAEMPDLYVISKGIKSGDRILLEGIRKVRDNDKITYEFKKPEEVMHHLQVYVE